MTLLTTAGRTALTYTGYMNGEAFQQDALVTHGGRQYAAFWDSHGFVNVARRALPGGDWRVVRLTDYATTSTDSHNTISVGVCARDGTIHLAFDMHSSELRYRRSVPGADDSFGPVVTTLTGTTMHEVTYPRFIPVPDGTLQLSLRTGLSGCGDEVLYEYVDGQWTYIGKFLDGTTADVNAYLFGIEYDATGRLHTTWTVRDTPDPSTNHDIYYAYSDDRGRSWDLVAEADALRVWAIGRNRGLINQEAQVVDPSGGVHVLASHLPDTAADIADFAAARAAAVLVHYRRDPASGRWSRSWTPFREGTSRGDIAVDATGRLYLAACDPAGRLTIATAAAGSSWTVRHTTEPLYQCDPLIDRARLRSHGVLSVVATRRGGSRIDVLDWPDTPRPGATER